MCGREERSGDGGGVLDRVVENEVREGERVEERAGLASQDPGEAAGGLGEPMDEGRSKPWARGEGGDKEGKDLEGGRGKVLEGGLVGLEEVLDVLELEEHLLDGGEVLGDGKL